MQVKLPLQEEVTDLEIMNTCATFRDALRLAREKSGKSEKVIVLELQERGHNIDTTTLSLALAANPSQKKNFPSEAVTDYIEITNTIPLRFLALKFGYGLIRLKSTLEHENEQLKAQLAEKEKELAVITNFMKSIKG